MLILKKGWNTLQSLCFFLWWQERCSFKKLPSCKSWCHVSAQKKLRWPESDFCWPSLEVAFIIIFSAAISTIKDDSCCFDASLKILLYLIPTFWFVPETFGRLPWKNIAQVQNFALKKRIDSIRRPALSPGDTAWKKRSELQLLSLHGGRLLWMPSTWK